jgi:molecular chaperone DnaK (HSP70)
MMKYVVGIDLGTTNTVVAYTEIGSDNILLFEMEQLIAPGEIKASPLLPSLRYHPANGELASGEFRLPWTSGNDAAQEQAVFGSLARKLGVQVPGRLVTSAKSWLSHAAVDRLASILPWGADADVDKVSPVAASASYLTYVRAAWNWHFPECPLEQQEVILTVPASFDEGARTLTLKAANQAGLSQLRLLEEPQAACYDWLFRHRNTLDTALAQTRMILVCDVGGGTTDLSLIKVAMQDGQPQLSRIGVGKHLMLGGDNMDLVLAHMVEARITASAGKLSASRMSQMIERCRNAKEQLLAADAPDRATVTLLGAGARLIGGAQSAELTREEVERTIVDGFFPMVAVTDQVRQKRSGLVEFGLPYASDPAVTRHLAHFLGQHSIAIREAMGGDSAIPDALLLNGGVFRADALARRLEQTLNIWRGAPLQLLHNDNPDVAVARGAVAYALARQGLGLKIGGGSPRSYFLVLDNDKVADSSRPGICVLPRGSEQGREILLKDRIFALRLGQPVRFHLVSSIADATDRAVPHLGELVDLSGDAFVTLPPIATVLKAETATGQGKQEVPVQLATSLTEIGTLEMHCVDMNDARQRWLLEFQLRGENAPLENNATLPPGLDEALEKIDRIFGGRAQQVLPKEVRQLRLTLEKLLGNRERWDTPLLRRLFDALWTRARGRRRSSDHERLWCNLAGYCLRPGFGYPLDEWRIEQLWSIFDAGVEYRKDSQVCSEWWTLWRRVAGGLGKEAQLRLLDDFAFNVQEDKAEIARRPVTLVAGSEDDMIRLVASLERIPADYKTEVGTWLLKRLQTAPDSLTLWAIGRIGARQPFYGSAHDVVSIENVEDWLEGLFALDWKRVEPAAFAAVHLARMTGDRSRDVSGALRDQIIMRLKPIEPSPAWITMLRETVTLDEASEKRMLGESLPPGLKLIR